jgi:hypothetical protein
VAPFFSTFIASLPANMRGEAKTSRLLKKFVMQEDRRSPGEREQGVAACSTRAVPVPMIERSCAAGYQAGRPQNREADT